MRKKNSLTTTSAVEVYQQIGTQLLETGSDELMNTKDEKEQTKAHMLLQVPPQFRIDGLEYLVLRSKEIQTLMGRSNDFQKENSADDIAPDLLLTCSSHMKLCRREDVAVCLERIASTFQVKVPDQIGLQEYFDILSPYPKFVLEYCTDSILIEYAYPRLPVPKDFIDRCEPYYQEHYKWLTNIVKNFHALEIFKRGNMEVINKYL